MTNNETLIFNEQCAICLEKEQKNPALLLPCDHSFCIDCIILWLERNPTCPLCKTKPSTIIYDVKSEKQYRLLHLDDEIKNQYSITHDTIPFHENRSRVYDEDLEIIQDDKIFTINFNKDYFIKYSSSLIPRLKNFIQRELETILRTYQIELLCEMILSLLSKKEISNFEKDLEPYLKNYTKKFLNELKMYASSNISSLEYYDEIVKYKTKEGNIISLTEKKRKREEEEETKMEKKLKMEH